MGNHETFLLTIQILKMFNFLKMSHISTIDLLEYVVQFLAWRHSWKNIYILHLHLLSFAILQ